MARSPAIESGQKLVTLEANEKKVHVQSRIIRTTSKQRDVGDPVVVRYYEVRLGSKEETGENIPAVFGGGGDRNSAKRDSRRGG